MSRPPLPPTPIRAERLRILREREGLSQEAFGEKIGFSQRQISDMECVKRRVTDGTCKEVIRSFGKYRLSWLLGNDEIMTQAEAVAWVKDEAQKQDDALARAISELLIASDIKLVTVMKNGEEQMYLEKDGIRVLFTNEMAETVMNEVGDYFEYVMFRIFR